MFKVILAALLSLVLGSAAAASDPAAELDAANKLVSSLHPQEGKISLPGAIATLDLPPNFRYLDPADSGRLLEAWAIRPARIRWA